MIQKMNKYLEHLIKDPLVYYVYQSDLSIYDLPSEGPSYIVITDEKYNIPEEFKGSILLSIKPSLSYDGAYFEFYKMQDWFQKVIKCDVLAWECSCLDKKFIVKEHVKLTITPDTLKLAQSFRAMLDPTVILASSEIQNGAFNKGRTHLFNVLKEARFSNQIIDNHKIVNYNEVKEDYFALFNAEDNDESIMGVFLEQSKKSIGLFLNRTEKAFKDAKIKKIIQNG